MGPPSVRAMATGDSHAWRRATTSPFLDGIRDGSLAEESFRRWLEQDRVFLAGLTRAWAGILSSAPVANHDLLASGIRSFVDEVSWLGRPLTSSRAGSTELAELADPLPTTEHYVDWLLDVASAPMAVALSAMWVVEAAYLEAWRAIAGEGVSDTYLEFVHHWTTPDFESFVNAIEVAADEALVDADGPTLAWARAAVSTTVAHEEAFWRMTTDEG